MRGVLQADHHGVQTYSAVGVLEEQVDHEDGGGLRVEEEMVVEQGEDLSGTSRRKTSRRSIKESLGADPGDTRHSTSLGRVEEGQAGRRE